jgi:hypothetical protein
MADKKKKTSSKKPTLANLAKRLDSLEKRLAGGGQQAKASPRPRAQQQQARPAPQRPQMAQGGGGMQRPSPAMGRQPMPGGGAMPGGMRGGMS